MHSSSQNYRIAESWRHHGKSLSQLYAQSRVSCNKLPSIECSLVLSMSKDGLFTTHLDYLVQCLATITIKLLSIHAGVPKGHENGLGWHDCYMRWCCLPPAIDSSLSLCSLSPVPPLDTTEKSGSIFSPHVQNRANYNRFPRSVAGWVLNMSKDGHSTTLLDNPVQCLTTITIKKGVLFFFFSFLCLSGISSIWVCVHCLLSCHWALLRGLMLSSLLTPLNRYLCMLVSYMYNIPDTSPC